MSSQRACKVKRTWLCVQAKSLPRQRAHASSGLVGAQPIGNQEVTECALVKMCVRLNLGLISLRVAADRTAFWIASSMLFSDEPATWMIL